MFQCIGLRRAGTPRNPAAPSRRAGIDAGAGSFPRKNAPPERYSTAMPAKTDLDIFLSAAQKGDVATLKEFLDTGKVTVNARKGSGRTAAFTAAIHGKTAALAFLMDAGADLNLRGSVIVQYGKSFKETKKLSPLTAAAHFGQTGCVIAILDRHFAGALAPPLRGAANLRTAVLDAVTAAVLNGKADTLDAMLSRGVSPNCPDGYLNDLYRSRQDRPVMTAAREVRPEVAACLARLVRHGADTGILDGHERTPLHVAASEGNAEGLRILLEAGADVDAIDMNDRMPIQYLSPFTRKTGECARLLIAAGANPDGSGGNKTPLLEAQEHRVVHTGPDPLTVALVEGGAEVTYLVAKRAAMMGHAGNLAFFFEKGLDPERMAEVAGEYLCPPASRSVIEAALLARRTGAVLEDAAGEDDARELTL